MPLDYNQTINLPKTKFPMRAGLPKREPDMLKSWYEKDIYGELMKHNEGKPRFILHDGPPFSNGYIHMGTSMNKCLKDFILRYKNMAGFHAPYTPGWDNHGMPIESAIIKQNKLDRKKMTIPEFRSACEDFAQNFINIQREQFIRLGVLGDWQHPYRTMDPAFEAEEVKVFGKMYEKGYIYKGLKPVYWCPHDETALAEAEIEYADDPCDSIYVKFPVRDDHGKLQGLCDLSKTYFVIWTTTTWTLPGNLAISLGPDFTYILMQVPNGEVYIVAEDLAASVAKAAGIESWTVLGKFSGRDLELMTATHPFFDRESVVLVGNHVTLEAGTGCVHTAPGHGVDDFFICKQYDNAGKTNIGVVVPVDARGHMTAEAGKFEGLYYAKANNAILEELKEKNALLALEHIVHSYPHCWRCKNPIIYRATDQWFCSVDSFKEDAVSACKSIQWMPEWGYDRMVSMLRERAEWCISRQRHWGLPIPVFYCSDCGKPICTAETIEAVSALFGEHGSNIWFEQEASQLLPDGFTCPHCGGTHFTKETDTLDCWFDSGSTHIASLMKNDPQNWPADLYLEGADQYRGWFQSSLLTAVATQGKAPYKAVLTHGWTVDGEGKAMHKSLGNAVAPETIIKQYGADLLRLWAASSDYRVDVRASDKIFKQLSDLYLKIRNTARYILGNLDDFDPDQALPFHQLEELDQWAVARYNQLVAKVRSSYDSYSFHLISHSIHNFCVVDMSNFYLDIIKDRLYCEGKDSRERRSAQSAIYYILDGMVRMLAPILAFTAEEIWSFMPHDKTANTFSVLLNPMPSYDEALVLSDEQAARWEKIRALRTDVNKALELARAAKTVGKSLDSEVILHLSPEAAAAFGPLKDYALTTLLIVSKVTVLEDNVQSGYEGVAFPGLFVDVAPATAPKCIRCWCHDEGVGTDSDHPELCPRCAAVVKAML
jgi:isoleucyl-tRNA synthetase